MSSLDLLVIGGGPAGIMAAVEGSALGLNVCLVHDQPLGGLLRAARRVERFPGTQAPCSGPELADRLAAQFQRCAARDLEGTARAIRPVATAKRPGPAWEVTLDSGEVVESRCLVLACGTLPKPLPPEVDASTTIHRDVRTLPRPMGGRELRILGGGEAAMDAGLWAADRGARVSLWIRSEQLIGNPGLVAEASIRLQIRRRQNWGAFMEEGGTFHEGGPPPRSTKEGGLRRPVEAMAPTWPAVLRLVCIGRIPRTELLDPLFPELATAMNSGNSPAPMAAGSGLFVAGDLLRHKHRYAALAAADGVLAAHLAHDYLQSVEKECFEP